MTETEWNDAAALSQVVEQADVGSRIDRYVAETGILTRSAVEKMIESGALTVNGGRTAKNYRLRLGDHVELYLPEPEPSEAKPQNIPLDILYEDEDLLVINKPCGMVVHPAAGNPDGTLVNALLYHCGDSLSGIGGVIRPGIVHRIDKDTSGLLVVAKNDETHLALSEQLKGHHIDRIYYAIALGSMREERGTVDAPIGRHPVDRKRMAVIRGTDARAREAVTHWQVLREGESDGGRFSLIRCNLETGRTHQIRVHLSSIGHPLLGDTLYGGGNTRFEARHSSHIIGQCLHAGELHFRHPRTQKNVHVTCPLPVEMAHLTRILFGEATPSLTRSAWMD